MSDSAHTPANEPEREGIELRCPSGPRRLLAMLRLQGEQPRYDARTNEVEFACSDCRRFLRQEGREVSLVLHRFNVLGQLTSSEIVPGRVREGEAQSRGTSVR